MEFSYFMPVRLLFGANVIDQLGATAKSYGTHALIVTGRSSTKRSGLLDRSIALLEAAGVRATVFNKVEPNPLTTTVMEGAALAREQGCDLVIGMGGGSMMDAAKAVAFCAVNGGDVNDYISGGKQGTGCLPILEVPTTCGTGSEANPFAVLTNPETKDKKSLWGDLIYALYHHQDQCGDSQRQSKGAENCPGRVMGEGAHQAGTLAHDRHGGQAADVLQRQGYPRGLCEL